MKAYFSASLAFFKITTNSLCKLVNSLKFAFQNKLEGFWSKGCQQKTLTLLRQLKFIESVMFQGKDVYSEDSLDIDPNKPLMLDVEAILVDML